MLMLNKFIPIVNNLIWIYLTHKKCPNKNSVPDKTPYENERDVIDKVVKVSVYICTYYISVVHSSILTQINPNVNNLTNN
jgi:hypothetical protein